MALEARPYFHGSIKRPDSLMLKGGDTKERKAGSF